MSILIPQRIELTVLLNVAYQCLTLAVGRALTERSALLWRSVISVGLLCIVWLQDEEQASLCVRPAIRWPPSYLRAYVFN